MFSATLMLTCLLNSTFVDSSLSVEIQKDTRQVVSAHIFETSTATYNQLSLSVLELDESKVELSGNDQNSELVRISTDLTVGPSYGLTSLQVGSQVESTGCYISEM